MRLSEINATLRDIRVSPVRSLGQTFLHDQNLARWIVKQADLTDEDYSGINNWKFCMATRCASMYGRFLRSGE